MPFKGRLFRKWNQSFFIDLRFCFVWRVGTHNWRDLHVIFLFMSGDLYQEQAVLRGGVRSSRDFELLYSACFSHSSSYKLHGTQKTLFTCSKLLSHTRDPLLSCRLLLWQLIWKKGSSLSSCSDEAQCGGEVVYSSRTESHTHTANLYRVFWE